MTVTTLITDATVVLPGGRAESVTVVMEGPTIREVSTAPPAGLLLSQDNVEVISGAGCYLTPGLIDIQFNGAFGCDLNHASISQIQSVLAKLPTFGVTSVLLTAITAPHMDMMTTINTMEEVIHHQIRHHSRPIGLHLEGPFISEKFRGAHPAASIQPPTLQEGMMLVSPRTRMMTLAPEVDKDGLLIKFLVDRGITVSASHTDADAHDLNRAVEIGLKTITHAFNAMRPFHHRDPGLVGLALCDRRISVQAIGDGVTLHPLTLDVIYRCKGANQMILVSDAMPLAGLPEGSQFRFADQMVTLKQGCAINEEGRLAGSSKLLNQCIQNMNTWQIAPFAELIQMTTENPARLISENFADEIGLIEPGFQADLVLWDKETLDVKSTWIGGKLVYEKSAVAKSPAN